MLNRRVYYISGFDPRGSRFYHRLFREEAKKSESVSGASIAVGKRKVLDELVTQWEVDAVWEGKSYKTDYRFMTWDDVMKRYWVSSIGKLILKSIPMYYRHSMSGLLAKYKQAGKGPYLFSMYPLIYCLAFILLVTLINAFVYVITSQFLNKDLVIFFCLISSYLIGKYLLKAAERNGVWWVLQSYFFQSRWMDKPLNYLEKRTQAFAERVISDQDESPVSEVILVGHCTGAILTIATMHKLLGLRHDNLKNKLTLVTLGQSIPYISYAPQATHFRELLQVVANNKDYPWFDMGARADPLCFQQVNPAEADGNTLDDKNVPYRFVVRPYKMFSPEKYKNLQKNKLRIHFQYLMAADIKTDFDYFEIVTGPLGNIQKYRT